MWRTLAVSVISAAIPLLGEILEPTSATDTDLYRDCCKRAVEDDRFFAEFKQHPSYTQVLEHLGRDSGRPYLDMIKKQTPEFFYYIENFKRNDLFGNPRKDVYVETGAISTTTIRYMKVASDLQMLFGSLNDRSIVEIGGGYGGQCLILSMLYQFKKYTIVDLPEALALTKKYLGKHNVSNVAYKTFDEAMEDESFDLMISNYAYSECTPTMREKYLREILSLSRRGYITGNYFEEQTGDYLSRCDISYKILPETPSTSPINVLMIWNCEQINRMW